MSRCPGIGLVALPWGFRIPLMLPHRARCLKGLSHSELLDDLTSFPSPCVRPWQPSIPASSPILSGRVYTSPLRNGKFAAIIPGDSVVEAVVTQGVNQTL